MKKIILIMALFGLTFQFLSAGTMYKKLEGGESFDTTADNFSDAFYTVGVTTMRSLDDGLETWLFEAEKLNPVIYLTTTKAAEIGISLLSDGYYARDISDTGGNTATWIQMTENTEAAAQYTGAPLFMQFDAWASTSTDYKGDDHQNGEVVLRFFPVLDMQRFSDDGGAIIESWYRKNDETSWTKFSTKVSGPNGHVVTSEDLWGDLTDGYPVEITWDAKTDIPDFDGNISVRIRAKYGSTPFATDPAPYVGGSSGGGSSGGGSTPSALFELDPSDAKGISGYSYFDPAGADAATYGDAITKRDTILGASGLTSVGSYDDGVQTYPVYDFQGMESARDQFVPGLTGRYYSINDTSLVAVQPAGT
jgi:hypothetical protein